jgi:hypothetical protein
MEQKHIGWFMLAAWCLCAAEAPAREPPTATADASSTPQLARHPVSLQVRLETWEMGAKEAARMMDKARKPAEIEKVRRRLLASPGSVLVFSPVLAAVEHSKAETRSDLERIFPTEFESPELSAGAFKTAREWKSMVSPERFATLVLELAVPKSFAVRNTGRTFETSIQPLGNHPRQWEVWISFRKIRRIGVDRYGAKATPVDQPLFAVFRTGGNLQLREGEWQLLSVQEPPRGPGEKPTGKRWVTLVRVDRAR